MNRAQRRSMGERSAELSTKFKPDLQNMSLRDMRFDSPQASAMFFQLRYFSEAFAGSRPNSVRLPPIDQSVSVSARSGGFVYKAFPHGLMYGDQLSLIAGVGLFIALNTVLFAFLDRLFGGINPFVEFFATFTSDGVGMTILNIFLFVFMLGMSPLLLAAILGDVIGFRFGRSALFDRNGGKIHLFSDQSLPWAPWHYGLKTYDWRCVRAEIDIVTMWADPTSCNDASLHCVVMDRPGGEIVIDRFVLGMNMPARQIQALLDTWEHVRRFMQHEGPLFADQHDKPNTSLGRRPLWKHLLDLPMLQVKVTVDMFRIGWEDKSLAAVYWGLIWVVLLPCVLFGALWGFLPWLSGLAKRDPIWPAEIIASVGGMALNGKDLDAWRSVVPEKGRQSSPDGTRTNEQGKQA